MMKDPKSPRVCNFEGDLTDIRGARSRNVACDLRLSSRHHITSLIASEVIGEARQEKIAA